MAPTHDQRLAFGQRLRALREAVDLSTADLAALLTEGGHEISGASVSGWERGEWSPRHRGIVDALERIFGVPDELGPLLGYGADEPTAEQLFPVLLELARQHLAILEEAAQQYRQGAPDEFGRAVVEAAAIFRQLSQVERRLVRTGSDPTEIAARSGAPLTAMERERVDQVVDALFDADGQWRA